MLRGLKAKITLEDKDKPLKLIPLGDIHYGNKGCNKRAAIKLRDWIMQNDNVRVIGMGDYGDFITHNDIKRFEWSEIDKDLLKGGFDRHSIIEKQYHWIRDYFTPLAEAGKLIGLHYGNHDYQIRKRHHWDIVQSICEELDVRYLGYQSLIKLQWDNDQFHRPPVKILSAHGWGGGMTIGGKASKLNKLISHANADIYLMGHVHAKDTHTDGYYDLIGNDVVKRKRIFALTGTFLDDALYAEHGGYPPIVSGTVKISIYPHKSPIDFHASV